MEVSETNHRPVLLEESVEALAIKPAGVYVDCTFGRGGHTRSILQRLNAQGRLIAFDKDPEAVGFAETMLGGDSRFLIIRGSFSMLGRVLDQLGLKGRVDGVLFDLGVSSPQLDDPERGFSFLRDGPLDMRMDPDAGPSAADWLATAGEREIADVLKSYGEERHARRIARAIVASSQTRPIRTTRALAEVVAAANPSWEQHKHPATRTFQALRIMLNRELDELKTALKQITDVLAPGGRLVAISFHSLEDRIVKNFIRDESRGDDFPVGVPVTQSQLKPRMRQIGKAIGADAEEVRANPRARSAVMRVAERLV